jgi:hypothetical protein
MKTEIHQWIVNHGDEEFIVHSDDRVLYDPSIGQYENGWWVLRSTNAEPGKPDEYFLSDEGVLYTTDDGNNFDVSCGRMISKRA